jgi:hypothetical protein
MITRVAADVTADLRSGDIILALAGQLALAFRGLTAHGRAAGPRRRPAAAPRLPRPW